MKKLLLWTFCVLINFCAFAQSEDFTLAVIESGGPNGQARLFEKFELGIEMPASVSSKVQSYLDGGEGLNPYNPDDVNVEAVFTAPNGETQKVYGFFMVDYQRAEGDKWEKRNTDFSWRIRFAPDLVGAWKVTVSIITEKNSPLRNRELAFQCVNSKNKGFVVRGHTGDESDRYLRYSGTGETFFVLGENMVWADFKLKTTSHDRFTSWLTKLSDNGGNFVRVGMINWTYGIEWEKLGDYHQRQNRAWEFDQLLDVAKDKGVYIDLLINLHNSFLPKPYEGNIYNWEFNPYRKELNGVTNPIDFFTDLDARNYHKRRLRYIESRWGYSTNLVVLELFSELDKGLKDYNDNEDLRAKSNAWFAEMNDYLKKDLGDQRRLVTASYSTKEDQDYKSKVFPLSDMTCNHDYGRDEDQNYKKRYGRTRYFVEHSTTRNFPALQQEVGANIYATLDQCDPITMHNALWSTALSGNCGTGLNWWWDYAVDEKNYYAEYKPLQVFVEGEPLAKKPYASERWRNSKVETFSLVALDDSAAIGWVHNRSYWWPNFYTTNSCIKTLIDNNNGHTSDQADNSKYANWRDKDKVTNYQTVRFKVKGLKRGGLFKKVKYEVTWYHANGEGGVLSAEDGTPKTQSFRTNCFGTAKVFSPPLDRNGPDWGYKLRLVE